MSSNIDFSKGKVQLVVKNNKFYINLSGNILEAIELSGDKVNITNNLNVNNDISLSGNLFCPSRFIIDPHVYNDNSGTVVIKGNLEVEGTKTIINSSQLDISDLNIVLAKNYSNIDQISNAGIKISNNDIATLLYNNNKWNTNIPFLISGDLDICGGKINNYILDSSLSKIFRDISINDNSINLILSDISRIDSSLSYIFVNGVASSTSSSIVNNAVFTSLSGRVDVLDSSMKYLFENGVTSSEISFNDASFGNIDISGIINLNPINTLNSSTIKLLENLDAKFNNVNISGDLNILGENTIIDSSNIEIKNNRILFNTKNTLQDVGIDISYSDTSAHFLYNKDTNTWSTEDSSLKTNNIDLSGIINLYPQNSVNIGTINSLQNLDVSFNNVDISGIFKLNGIDISNRLNNLDTSLSSLLQNSNTSDDVSFNNVDISGILKGNISNNNKLLLDSHIIPTENAQYDLGSAEKKIRHLFLSDNSLWIGDNNKIDISNGEIQLKKRNIGKIPKIITDLSSDLCNNDITLLQVKYPNIIIEPDISSIPIDKWLLIAKQLNPDSNIEIDELFDTDPDKNIDLFAKIKDLEQKIKVLETNTNTNTNTETNTLTLTVENDETTNTDTNLGDLTVG